MVGYLVTIQPLPSTAGILRPIPEPRGRRRRAVLTTTSSSPMKRPSTAPSERAKAATATTDNDDAVDCGGAVGVHFGPEVEAHHRTSAMSSAARAPVGAPALETHTESSVETALRADIGAVITPVDTRSPTALTDAERQLIVHVFHHHQLPGVATHRKADSSGGAQEPKNAAYLRAIAATASHGRRHYGGNGRGVAIDGRAELHMLLRMLGLDVEQDSVSEVSAIPATAAIGLPAFLAICSSIKDKISRRVSAEKAHRDGRALQGDAVELARTAFDASVLVRNARHTPAPDSDDSDATDDDDGGHGNDHRKPAKARTQSSPTNTTNRLGRTAAPNQFVTTVAAANDIQPVLDSLAAVKSAYLAVLSGREVVDDDAEDVLVSVGDAFDSLADRVVESRSAASRELCALPIPVDCIETLLLNMLSRDHAATSVGQRKSIGARLASLDAFVATFEALRDAHLAVGLPFPFAPNTFQAALTPQQHASAAATTDQHFLNGSSFDVDASPSAIARGHPFGSSSGDDPSGLLGGTVRSIDTLQAFGVRCVRFDRFIAFMFPGWTSDVAAHNGAKIDIDDENDEDDALPNLLLRCADGGGGGGRIPLTSLLNNEQSDDPRQQQSDGGDERVWQDIVDAYFTSEMRAEPSDIEAHGNESGWGAVESSDDELVADRHAGTAQESEAVSLRESSRRPSTASGSNAPRTQLTAPSDGDGPASFNASRRSSVATSAAGPSRSTGVRDDSRSHSPEPHAITNPDTMRQSSRFHQTHSMAPSHSGVHAGSSAINRAASFASSGGRRKAQLKSALLSHKVAAVNVLANRKRIGGDPTTGGSRGQQRRGSLRPSAAAPGAATKMVSSNDYFPPAPDTVCDMPYYAYRTVPQLRSRPDDLPGFVRCPRSDSNLLSSFIQVCRRDDESVAATALSPIRSYAHVKSRVHSGNPTTCAEDDPLNVMSFSVTPSAIRRLDQQSPSTAEGAKEQRGKSRQRPATQTERPVTQLSDGSVHVPFAHEQFFSRPLLPTVPVEFGSKVPPRWEPTIGAGRLRDIIAKSRRELAASWMA